MSYKVSAYSAGELGSIPRSGGSPGEGNGNRLQYSCLESPMDGESQQITVHGIAKSQIRLSNLTFTLVEYILKSKTTKKNPKNKQTEKKTKNCMHIIEQQINHSRAACLVAQFASLALEFRLNSVPRFQWDIYFRCLCYWKSVLSRVNHKTVLIISGRVLLKRVRGL